MTDQTNRRRFLKTATAGATGLALASQLSARAATADGKMRIALIGVGERGRGFIKKVASTGQKLVAVCDADQWRIDRAGALPADTKIYRDFRNLLAEMGDSIDAVIIATPHHSQPAISAAAIRAGKHVYCEKPIAHDVGEARDFREPVGKHNVVTQMGNQGVSTDAFRRILEQVQDGAVGEIREAYPGHVADANPKPHEMREPPADPAAVPEGLDWDLDLGPAAERQYDYKYLKWGGRRSARACWAWTALIRAT